MLVDMSDWGPGGAAPTRHRHDNGTDMYIGRTGDRGGTAPITVESAIEVDPRASRACAIKKKKHRVMPSSTARETHRFRHGRDLRLHTDRWTTMSQPCCTVPAAGCARASKIGCMTSVGVKLPHRAVVWSAEGCLLLLLSLMLKAWFPKKKSKNIPSVVRNLHYMLVYLFCNNTCRWTITTKLCTGQAEFATYFPF